MLHPARGWACFHDLPDDVLTTMPPHVRLAFAAARQHRFGVELICPRAQVPADARPRRRLVLIADDLGEFAGDDAGPIAFDLGMIAGDVQAVRRAFVLAQTEDIEVYVLGYAEAVADLANGFDVALIVETQPGREQAWVRTLTSLRAGDRVIAAAGQG
jgi:hypothetical protein